MLTYPWQRISVLHLPLCQLCAINPASRQIRAQIALSSPSGSPLCDIQGGGPMPRELDFLFLYVPSGGWKSAIYYPYMSISGFFACLRLPVRCTCLQQAGADRCCTRTGRPTPHAGQRLILTQPRKRTKVASEGAFLPEFPLSAFQKNPYGIKDLIH